MEIKLRFKGIEAFRIIRDAARAAAVMDLNDPWFQHSIIKGPHAEIDTYSGKGQWKATTNGKVSIIEFNGYRGSFWDGTRFFVTSNFPWKDGEVIEVKSSTPKEPITFRIWKLEGHKYCALPNKGSTKDLPVHDCEIHDCES